jgi:hypothetical protein
MAESIVRSTLNACVGAVVGWCIYGITPPSDWRLLIAVLASLFVIGVERIADAIKDTKPT